MQTIGRFLKKTDSVFVVIAIISLLFMMLVTVYNITARSVFGHSLVAAIEIAEQSSVIFVTLGMAFTQLCGSNITVPIVLDRFKPRTRRVFDTVALVFSMVMVIIFIWTGIIFGAQTIQQDEVTNIMKISTGPFRMLWVAGCVFLLVALVASTVRLWKKEL
jgi:TRAP-type C4-dicarboxylate transport system permease small subunit